MLGCGFDLVVLAPKHPGHRLFRCQPFPRLSKRLNSAERCLKLNSRWGEEGQRAGREGKRARERKRELSFSLYLF